MEKKRKKKRVVYAHILLQLFIEYLLRMPLLHLQYSMFLHKTHLTTGYLHDLFNIAKLDFILVPLIDDDEICTAIRYFITQFFMNQSWEEVQRARHILFYSQDYSCMLCDEGVAMIGSPFCWKKSKLVSEKVCTGLSAFTLRLPRGSLHLHAFLYVRISF